MMIDMLSLLFVAFTTIATLGKTGANIITIRYVKRYGAQQEANPTMRWFYERKYYLVGRLTILIIPTTLTFAWFVDSHLIAVIISCFFAGFFTIDFVRDFRIYKEDYAESPATNP